MSTLEEFVRMMIEQTLEQMEEQQELAPHDDEWARFLEGKLLAFRLVMEGFERKSGCDC